MVNVALARSLAAARFLKTALVVEAPSRTQSGTGEWVDGWTQIYPSVSVPSPLCYVTEASVTDTDDRGVSVVRRETLVCVSPTLTILPSYRVRVGGVIYQVSRILNEDDTFQAVRRVIVTRV